MRRLFLVLVVFGFTSSLRADPAIISDADRPNWLAVGRVNVGGFNSKALCSGALIGPRQVLTAAHCVATPDGVSHLLAKVRFVAGWHKGEFSGVGEAEAIVVHPEYSDRRIGSFSRIEKDLALITLKEPMKGVTPLPLFEGTFSEAPVKMLGYRRDRPHILTDYQGCSAYVFRDAMLSIDCEVVQGTSGAPVLAEQNGQWGIVGVVSSRLENRGRDKALAALARSIVSDPEPAVPASNP